MAASKPAVWLCLILIAWWALPQEAQGVTVTNSPVLFTNSASVRINDYAPATPYPSAIAVSGLPGRVAKVTLRLADFSHTSVADVNVLLCGPENQSTLVMSHAASSLANHVQLTFDDAATGVLAGTVVLSGFYQPSQRGARPLLPVPAPPPPYGTNLSCFADSNPNGQWNLFVTDDQFLDAGTINGGWQLAISTYGAAPEIWPIESQTAEAGSTVRFKTRVAGEPPFAYHWLKGSEPIPQATNSYLELAGVDFGQAGLFCLAVSNAFGAITSAPVMLAVIPTVSHRPVPGLRTSAPWGTWVNFESTDLQISVPNWAPLGSYQITQASPWFFDLSPVLPMERCYRSWHNGIETAPDQLELHLVTALTLTGSIGASVRIDYINQFGPTDAWAQLTTVTLTNSTVLYFDTYAVDQPPRLYRLQTSP